MEYSEFVKQKQVQSVEYGHQVSIDDLNENAFDWQKRVVQWAVSRGRAALFLDTGLGKTLCQLMWAQQVCKATGGRVMLHCPLGVRQQTKRESEKFGICVPVVVADDQTQMPDSGICIVNYQKLDKFDTSLFAGVVLDESSILKGLTSKLRAQLTEEWGDAKYRLACTATPSPNDTMELGSHAEFLGVCSQQEMQSKYFVNDSGNTQKWRLKGHAIDAFWDWVCDWACCVSMPSDIGGDDTGYHLPELVEHTHTVHVPAAVADGFLFDCSGISATNIHEEKRHTSPFRADKTAELVNSNDQQWIVWCDSNYESDDLVERIPDAVEIRGSLTDQQKEDRLEQFSSGDARVIITKPSISGMGMNWQHCSQMVFHSISYSFEQKYQAVRRCYRFGQKQPVQCHSVTTDTEHAIAKAVSVKSGMHENMKERMRVAMSRSDFIAKQDRGRTTYRPIEKMEIPTWLKQSDRKTANYGSSTTETAAN